MENMRHSSYLTLLEHYPILASLFLCPMPTFDRLQYAVLARELEGKGWEEGEREDFLVMSLQRRNSSYHYFGSSNARLWERDFG